VSTGSKAEALAAHLKASHCLKYLPISAFPLQLCLGILHSYGSANQSQLAGKKEDKVVR
jgi:hypothetical protein